MTPRLSALISKTIPSSILNEAVVSPPFNFDLAISFPSATMVTSPWLLQLPNFKVTLPLPQKLFEIMVGIHPWTKYGNSLTCLAMLKHVCPGKIRRSFSIMPSRSHPPSFILSYEVKSLIFSCAHAADGPKRRQKFRQIIREYWKLNVLYMRYFPKIHLPRFLNNNVSSVAFVESGYSQSIHSFSVSV